MPSSGPSANADLARRDSAVVGHLCAQTKDREAVNGAFYVDPLWHTALLHAHACPGNAPGRGALLRLMPPYGRAPADASVVVMGECPDVACA